MIRTSHQFHTGGQSPVCQINVVVCRDKMSAHHQHGGVSIDQVGHARIVVYWPVAFSPPVESLLPSWLSNSLHSLVPPGQQRENGISIQGAPDEWPCMNIPFFLTESYDPATAVGCSGAANNSAIEGRPGNSVTMLTERRVRL